MSSASAVNDARGASAPNGNGHPTGDPGSSKQVEQSFGSWMKARRKELDLTQEALADQAGCSTEMVRKMEDGRRKPSRQLAELVASALQVPCDEWDAFVQLARTQSHPAGSPGGLVPFYPRSLAAESAGDVALANPFRGLDSFREADVLNFFGRESLTCRLTARLAEEGCLSRFLAIVGPSGSGKSSVARAGLIPAVRRLGLPGGARPVFADVSPGASPFGRLAGALQSAAGRPLPGLSDELTSGPGGLRCAAGRSLVASGHPDGALFLLIDQFEELFTNVQDEAVRRAFLDTIYQAVSGPDSPLWIVITLRADFYDRPLAYGNWCDLLRRRTEPVGPMSAEELHRAIVGPIERVGATIEPELAAAIEHETGDQPGTLPLMQYVLTELFEQREGRTLTLAAYRSSGGLHGALGRRADAIYDALQPAEQEEARQLFLRLVALDEGAEDTRRRVLRAELASAARDEEAMDNVLEVFGRYRLLTFDRGPVTGRPTVEVAHEALIRHWARLREWLDANRSDLRLQRQLAAATTEWEGSGKDQSFLARGSRLAQYQALAEASGTAGVALNKEERDYLRASLLQRDRERMAARRRMRLAIAGFAAALVIISMFAFAAVVQANIASDQARVATEERSTAFSREVAAESVAGVKGDSMRSLLLGIEAARIAHTGEAENAIRQALLELQPPHVLYQGHEASGSMDFSPDSKRVVIAEHTGPVLIRDIRTGGVLATLDHKQVVDQIRFSGDGRWIAGGSRDDLVWIWNGQTGKTVYSLTGHSAPIFAVAFSPDGKWVASGSADATARLWDVASGKQVAEMRGHTGAVNAVEFSPDGKRVVTASDDGTARMWDATTGRQLLLMDGHSGPAATADFNPDGKLVATTNQDNLARLWDATSGKLMATLAGHSDLVNSARFSGDGRWLATASNDGTTRLWDVAALRKGVPDGQRAVSALILDSGPTMDARFSPDNKWVVTTCNNPGEGHQWVGRVFEVNAGKPVAEVGGQSPVNDLPYGRPYPAARFSPNGKWLLVADGHAVGLAVQWEFYQPLDYLLSIVSQYTTRQLTCDEIQAYLHREGACATPSPAPSLGGR